MATTRVLALSLFFSAARRGPGSRHARSSRRRGRFHRRLFAYRDVSLVHSEEPPNEQVHRLLLVHIRHVVGWLSYQVCEGCARGVVTEVDVVAPLQDSGLGTRAVSHLRSCYPQVRWHSGLTRRMTRDLAHRMRLYPIRKGQVCPHLQVSGNNDEQLHNGRRTMRPCVDVDV